MSVRKQILDWSKSQPTWRQDALRRLLAGALSEEDQAQLFVLLKAAHDLEATEIVAVPLTDFEGEDAAASASPIKLCKVYEVNNANRLAPDQTLSFALGGVTLVYGDNGSGKSGYARILKGACSARAAAEPILNNIFAKAPKTPASAKIEFVDGGDPPSTVDWTDGKTQNQQLRRISVFDSKCAAVYVDNENQATFVPYGLDCFERLVGLCDQLKSKLAAEKQSLQGVTAVAVVTTIEGTPAHAFLAALGDKTDADFDTATTWSEPDGVRLTAITPLISDADKRAIALKVLHSTAESWANLATVASTQLSNAAVDTLKKLKADLKAAGEALRLAATSFKNEPVQGVGSSSWRTLFEAARQFSEKEGYPSKTFPVTEDAARCILCQQILDDDGQKRLRRFDTFIRDAVTTRADSARAAWAQAVEVFQDKTKGVQALPEDVAAQLKAECPNLQTVLLSFFEAAAARYTQVLAGVIGDDPLELGAEPAVDAAVANTALGELKAMYEAAEAATKAEGAKALRKEFEELTSKKALCDNKQQAKKRLDDLRHSKKLDAAIAGCVTTGISAKGTALLKEHVSTAFEKALTKERQALGIKQIPLTLFSRSPKGVASHQLRLEATTYAGNTSAILSEGEHRSVALAAFFAELGMAGGADPIIVDDPVSSLDHQRRLDVARRLVEEAKARQVIIFTHDLLFYIDIATLAAEAKVPVTRVAVQRGAKGFGTVDPDGDPWEAKLLGRRRAWLEQQLAKLKKLHAAGQKDEYEKEAQYFYIRLRETWERMVEEKLFANVVVRFRRSVETKRLAEAVVDDELVTKVFHGMSAISSYAAHDTPAAAGVHWPDPDGVAAHLSSLSECLAAIEVESKATKVRREKLEKAPKSATVTTSPKNN
ncbi:MAG: AAA family ATPase [Reyranella sp.]|nr:AAA family ATPase [Reyranella sp.]